MQERQGCLTMVDEADSVVCLIGKVCSDVFEVREYCHRGHFRSCKKGMGA